MKKVPIKFVYIQSKELDSLFKDPSYVKNSVYDYVVKNGNHFEVDEDIFNAYFLDNMRIRARLLQMLLNETAPVTQTSKDYVVCHIDRFASIFFYEQILKSDLDTDKTDLKAKTDLINFLSQLNNRKIYALLIYSKKDGWFDYDSVKVKNDSQVKMIQQLSKE